MKTITFAIDSQGNTSVVDAEGYGVKCLEATANLEKRLGKVDEGSRTTTDNMFLQESTGISQQL